MRSISQNKIRMLTLAFVLLTATTNCASAGSSAAVETSASRPTPTATPMPQQDTSIEVEAAAEAPAPEPTAPPSRESTPEPTPESTPEPTPESTPEPTPEPTPATSDTVKQVLHPDCVGVQQVYRQGAPFTTSDFCSFNIALAEKPLNQLDCNKVDKDQVDHQLKAAWPDNATVNAVRDVVNFEYSCFLGDARPFLLFHRDSIVDHSLLDLPSPGQVIADADGVQEPTLLEPLDTEWVHPLMSSWALTLSEFGPDQIGQTFCVFEFLALNPGIRVDRWSITLLGLQGTRPGHLSATYVPAYGETIGFDLAIPRLNLASQVNPGDRLGLFPSMDTGEITSRFAIAPDGNC